ncbi:uncharacterized protein [Clytia hemisphaerica]|uniref:Uncharacterized protein n=1 Tax=Clytia hemisphaerica TaxID=252671 RepID=A0A7M5UNL7_9CNID|eukprot:TCONS_00005049-protein
MSFRSHFRCSNLKLKHEESKDFYISTCSCIKPKILVIIRGLLAIYCITLLTFNMIYYFHHQPNPSRWFTFYENLTYIILTLYLSMAFIVTGAEVLTLPKSPESNRVDLSSPDQWNEYSMDHLSHVDITKNDQDPSTADQYSSYSSFSSKIRQRLRRRKHMMNSVLTVNTGCKIFWVLRNIAATSTVVCVGIYWPYLHNYKKDFQLNLSEYITIDSHGINLGLVIIDFLLTRTPFRILHFVHPLIFNLLYIIFNYLYSTMIGEIYKDIDWSSSPLVTTGIFAAVLVFMLLSHFALFLLHCCVVYVDTKTKIGFFIVLFCLLFILFLVFTLLI